MYSSILNNKRKILVLSGLLLSILLLVFFPFLNREQNNDTIRENENNNREILYSDKYIEIYSIFPSSLINIDGAGQFVEDVASIEFKNTSGTFIKKCDIHVNTEQGDTLSFTAEDVSNEMEVLAFEKEDKSIGKDEAVNSFSCIVETDDTDVLLADYVEISEDEMEFKVKNTGKENLSGLIVSCHCVMDGASYGGTKFDYIIPELKVGKTATIFAEDCYFGEVKVVRVAVKQ